MVKNINSVYIKWGKYLISKQSIKYDYVCVCSVAQLCHILCYPRTVALQTLLSWNFAAQENWNFQIQGIFPTQGSNLNLLHLLHQQGDSLPLCHLGGTSHEERKNCEGNTLLK